MKKRTKRNTTGSGSKTVQKEAKRKTPAKTLRERKQAEEALRASERQMCLAFDGAQMDIWGGEPRYARECCSRALLHNRCAAALFASSFRL